MRRKAGVFSFFLILQAFEGRDSIFMFWVFLFFTSDWFTLMTAQRVDGKGEIIKITLSLIMFQHIQANPHGQFINDFHMFA